MKEKLLIKQVELARKLDDLYDELFGGGSVDLVDEIKIVLVRMKFLEELLSEGD